MLLLFLLVSISNIPDGVALSYRMRRMEIAVLALMLVPITVWPSQSPDSSITEFGIVADTRVNIRVLSPAPIVFLPLRKHCGYECLRGSMKMTEVLETWLRTLVDKAARRAVNKYVYIFLQISIAKSLCVGRIIHGETYRNIQQLDNQTGSLR